MNHKYSTMAIFLLFGVSTIILVSGLDGSGTAGYIPVYYSPDRLINSIIFINGSSVSINGSDVCTSSNNLCNNSITNNITNNITYNITNNFSVNESKFPINLTTIEDGSIFNVRICLFNSTCYNDSFTDSTGGGGGFSSDQVLNTTSNVTFENLIVTTNTTSDVYKVSGYSTTPTVFADNDANTGIMFDGPDIMSIHTGGIQAILVNTLQYTGLGMTPNQRLTVNGSGNFTQNISGLNILANLNWSFLQNIPAYIIDYMPYITSVQTNTTNVNNSLMNEISLQSANNVTQSNQITNLINSNVSLNSKLNSAITNYTADNTTQATLISQLQTSNLTKVQLGSINCTAGNLLYNITANSSGVFGTCVADQSSSSSTTVRAGRNYTSNAGIMNMTGIGFSLSANKNYTLECDLIHIGAAATTGMNVTINYTGTVRTVDVVYDTWSSATAKLLARLSNINTIAVGTGSSTTGTISRLSGGLETTNAGTLNISIGTEISASLTTLSSYSYCILTGY